MEVEDTEPKRHEKLYFSDGNIVVCSGGVGSDRVVFKVHKAVLCLHSSVFADMFSLPNVSRGNETYDGVPLVVTTDDAQGWEDLFGHLYRIKCARILVSLLSPSG